MRANAEATSLDTMYIETPTLLLEDLASKRIQHLIMLADEALTPLLAKIEAVNYFVSE